MTRLQDAVKRPHTLYVVDTVSGHSLEILQVSSSA